ncbi:MAG: hypothetical protein AMK75_07520, partial [Planctomycetes bacterium SM23_65]
MSDSTAPQHDPEAIRRKNRRLVLILSVIVVVGLTIGVYKMAHYNPNYVEKVDDANRIILKSGEGVNLIGVAVLPWEIPGLGQDAHKFVKNLIFERYIRIETDKKEKDAAGWTLGYVFVEKDGKEIFINEELLRRGLARLKLAF